MRRAPSVALVIIGVCVLSVSAGCAAPARRPGAGPGPHLPPDFAIEFHVLVRLDLQPGKRRPAHFVVEANRDLRVSRRARTAGRTYPPRLRRLSYDEYESLYALVWYNHLMAEPTSPVAQRFLQGQRDVRVLYDVAVSAHGRTQHFVTTPGESPPTAQLRARLEQFAGKPDGGEW
jgi:hypothetical protein